jgi:NADH-quinone oxidoreductase subunit J
MLATLLFYLFAAVLSLSALMVVLARHPVHAVLFLILCFFNAAGLFVLLGAEFLAMLLVIVYVGAVAVLFLFVVMMLETDTVALRRGVMRHVAAGIALAVILCAEIVMLVLGKQLAPVAAHTTQQLENTRAIGQVLYTDYVYPFQVSGLILLVAMIGAIVLTLRHKPDAKRQNHQQQLARRRDAVVKLVSVEQGSGVE